MQFFAFLFSQWRVILPIAMLGYCLWSFNALVSERDDAINALSTYKKQQTELAVKQQHEFEVKLIKAKNLITIEQAKSIALAKKLNLDRDQLKNDLKRLYEGKIISIKRNMDSVSKCMLQPASSDNKETDLASNSIELASREQLDYSAAYRTLEEACTLTTIDYNQLRHWADVVCTISECKD